MLTFDDFLTQAGLIPNDYPAYTALIQYPLLASPGNDIYVGIDLFELFNQGGVTYTLGESFDIVNGVSSALPGYLIGTSEITLGSNGWETLNPLTGSVVAAADGAHCVPEPSSLFIVALGLIPALRGFSQRRRNDVNA